jgi:polyhydroxyalkanoate synthesis regulator phasin
VDPLTSKYPMLTPYQFASNTPIQAIDLDGLEAVSYQVEARGMYGLGILSIAASQTVGVIVDFEGNLAGFYTPSLGAGAGEGILLSSSFSIFKNAKSVKDIEGMGFNAGAFYAVPGVKNLIGGGELNIALKDDFSINKVGGTVSGTFLPGPNVGVGIGGYLEGTYTFMTDLINLKEFEGSKIFDQLVNDFGIDKSNLLNVVDNLYNKAKELRDQNQPSQSKDLDELLKERNMAPSDATFLPNKINIDKKSNDR